MTDLYHGPYPVDMTVGEAREEVLRMLQKATPYTPNSTDLADKLARLQRERDQAVEALRFYASNCDASETAPCTYEGNLCCKTARATLASIEQGDWRNDAG